MVTRFRESSYDQWARSEGLAVYSGHAIADVGALELAPWPRLGAKGAILDLEGMEGLTGMYVAEIPPGGELRPEKHLFDELIYVLSGRGATQVWNERNDPGRVGMFEWQTGSLFAPPLNTWHRLANGSGSEPVRFVAATSAPLVMDLFHNSDFVFGSEFVFDDRYDGGPEYFRPRDERRLSGRSMVWETNFIPDVRVAEIDLQGSPELGKRSTGYEMGGNILVGHIETWPPGFYDRAHFHGGGAIILILQGSGYTLLWPNNAGHQPYQAGKGEQVMRVDWRPGTVLSPGAGWFHQHFNAGREPSRFVAFRYGSHRYGARFHDVHSGKGALVDIKLGGTQVEYDDEDPEIRRRYAEDLNRIGVIARRG